METWIALLRGINVSGHRPVGMQRLRHSFNEMGFMGVNTYLQSGNVVFQQADTSSRNTLAQRIEKQLLRDFGFEIVVILRRSAEMRRILGGNPFVREKGVESSALYVTFLSSLPGKPGLEALDSLRSLGDRFHITGREIYLCCPDGYGRSKLSNSVLERRLGVGATTRNWRTTSALAEMAAA